MDVPKSKKRAEESSKIKQKKSSATTWGLVAGAVAVPLVGVLFVGAVAGWFGGGETRLSPEYYITADANPPEWDFLETLKPDEYQQLVDANKSFVLFVDQGGCPTAERLRGFIKDYASEAGIQVYRMMFSDLRETNLKGQVKYYPSVVVFSQGKPVAWLDTSSNDDVEEYNDSAAFRAWMDDLIVTP